MGRDTVYLVLMAITAIIPFALYWIAAQREAEEDERRRKQHGEENEDIEQWLWGVKREQK